MTWYDGGLLPPRPAELKDGQIMGDHSGGVLFVGTKGKLMTGCYGRDPILLPEHFTRIINVPNLDQKNCRCNGWRS